jgi:hypothetical protein
MLYLPAFNLGDVSVGCVCLLYCPWLSGVVTTLSLLNTMHAQHVLKKERIFVSTPL